MRENCLYGSEGGGAGTTGPSYPYQSVTRGFGSFICSHLFGGLRLDPGFRRGDIRQETDDALH
jgi:hypothetical protein